MLFRVLSKKEFRKFVGLLLADTEVIAPKQIGVSTDGKPIHQYLPVQAFGEIDLEYETTEYPAKTYFLPYRENLSICSFDEDDWTREIHYRLQPRVLLGLHACDINALLKLDKVLAGDRYPSPYYISRRRNTFIIGIDHDPCEGGFCQSVGADVVTHGFDLYLTDLGDRYFIAINSDRGFNALKLVAAKEPTKRDNNDYLKVRSRIASQFEPLEMHNLPNLLDIEFESDVWKRWSEKCMSCGSCSMVCPTCYCYGTTERISMNNEQGAKIKQLYSCNFLDFAAVAGGHNFRADRETRLKYRYYHQHRGFMEAYEEPLCVGCYRCGRACLAGINPPDIIRDLQTEHQE
ncbi:MAG: 4Fe-4S dicluster domain-containing protein [Fidelibacterota bacterium]|nr:MAG: 4Fe-4S dicluster domain-containing protein [Candidatus Neomarinimicrobiota bacterium]